MQKHKPYIIFTVMACLSFLWSTSRNMGQDLQPAMLWIVDDITVWQGEVFVLEDKTLTKLDAQLEAVKSVLLPLTPVPIPPAPIPDVSVRPSVKELELSPQVPPVDTRAGGRLCADQQKVYVHYEGVIFIFDHDLNYLLSKAQSDSR